VTENPQFATGAASSTGRRQKKKRGLLARLRLALLCAILLLLIAVQAPVFPHVVRTILAFRAWQNGVTLSIGKVEGNLFEPIVLRDLFWSYCADTGAVTRIEVRRARAWLAWSNIFPAPVSTWIRSAAESADFRPLGDNGLWFHELELDDVTARLSLPSGTDGDFGAEQEHRWLKRTLSASSVSPGIVTVRNGDLILDRGDDYLRTSGTCFTLSEIAPGSIRADQVMCKVDGTHKVFRSVRGLTSLQGSNATIAGIKLAPDVTLESLSLAAAEIATGRLTVSARLAAFGGNIEAEAETTIDNGEIRFDANGNFSTINVAGLATFLGVSEAAGGVLKEGHFTFRGKPRDFTKAEATVRLEAGAFQWESRQWDSLVLGLSLVEQRLQIPEFRLQQGKNQLSVKGTMELPQPGAKWWERQFDLKLDADIRNLTDLSALMLPEFKYAAGQLFIRGAISGSGAQPDGPAKFEGQMIVSGNGLQWRTAPLDNFNAALLFHGRELEIISAQLLRKDDFLRGSGRISLGDGSYSGEWRLAARDLGDYKALLSPHLLPVPLAGGIDAIWTGKGLGALHDGNFTARLNRFHLLGPGGTLPLDAEFTGAYRKGEVQIEKLRLAENGTVLTAGITVGPSAVNIRDLRVTNKNRLCLHGDAVLPLDLWRQWPDVNLARLLNEETVSRVHLEAADLDLRLTSRLTGVDWPLAGTLTGKLDANGPLPKLQLGGSARLGLGTVPLDWAGHMVREVEATLVFEGSSLVVGKAIGRHANGDFILNGRLDFGQPRNPTMEAEGTGTNQSETFSFNVKGPAARPAIVTEGNSPFGASPPPTAPTVPSPPPAKPAQASR